MNVISERAGTSDPFNSLYLWSVRNLLFKSFPHCLFYLFRTIFSLVSCRRILVTGPLTTFPAIFHDFCPEKPMLQLLGATHSLLCRPHSSYLHIIAHTDFALAGVPFSPLFTGWIPAILQSPGRALSSSWIFLCHPQQSSLLLHQHQPLQLTGLVHPCGPLH